MRDVQIPDFSVVAFTGAAWLVGLAAMLLVQTPGGPETSLFARTVLSTLSACGAIYLVKLGFDLRSSKADTQAPVREAIKRIERTRRAA